MFFEFACNLRDTTSFAILLLNTTPFPNAQNTSREWNPTPTQTFALHLILLSPHLLYSEPQMYPTCLISFDRMKHYVEL